MPNEQGNDPIQLITVEYEEAHAGAGVEEGWYPRVHPFRAGISDDPEKRARALCYQLQREPKRYRNIRMFPWTCGLVQLIA